MRSRYQQIIFYLLLAGGSFSYAGKALSHLMNAFLFSSKIEHTSSFGFLFTALALPAIVFRVPIQRSLKRFGGFRVLLVSEFLIFATTAAWSAWVKIGTFQARHLVIVSFALATLHAFFISAFFLSLPKLISHKALESYFSISGSLTQAGFLLGLMFFNLTMDGLPPWIFFAFDAATYLFSFIVISTSVLLFRPSDSEPNSTAESEEENSAVEILPNSFLHALRPWEMAVLATLPVGALELFNSSQITISLKLSEYGPKGLSTLEFAACIGIIAFGISYPRLKQKLRLSNGFYLTLTLILSLALVTLVCNRTSAYLSLAAALMFGAGYSYLATIGRAAVYAIGKKHANLENSILNVNMFESAMQIIVGLSIPSLINSRPISAALAITFVLPLFFFFSQGQKRISRGSSLNKTSATSRRSVS